MNIIFVRINALFNVNKHLLFRSVNGNWSMNICKLYRAVRLMIIWNIGIDKAVYTKTVNGSFRGASADDFELVLCPKLPNSKE